MSGDFSDSDNGTSSAPNKRKRYIQKYKTEWEKDIQFRGWISKSTKGNNYAFCKACCVHLTAGKCDLEKHAATRKHGSNAKKLIGQQTLLSMPSTSQATHEGNQVSEGEIRLAAFLAEHNLPFSVMEHVPKLLAAVCPDSNVAKKK